jgi:hypothetical protein
VSLVKAADFISACPGHNKFDLFPPSAQICSMNIYLLKTAIEGKETLLLSIVNPELDKEAKLTGKAIVGYIVDENKPLNFENVRFNPVFIDHFHKTIVFFSQFSDTIVSMVEQQQNGFIYITDQRSKDPDPQPEDIIGSFEVKNGELVSGSYVANPAYKLITENGAFVLQKELEALLYSTAY